MSDDDHRHTRSSVDSQHAVNSRRLLAIKLNLQELTREKTKYNVEKLTHDGEFLKGDIEHLRQVIRGLNTQINTQIQTKRTLNAEMTNFQSHAGLSYTSLEIASRDQERYQKELSKTNKGEEYRNLARQRIDSIVEALPKLQKLEEYKDKLKAAEDAQDTARKKREVLEESLNSKLRKQAEIKQLLTDSEMKLPEMEEAIEKLRAEREEILKSSGEKKAPRPRRRCRFDVKQIDSPDQASVSSPSTLNSSIRRSLTDEEELLNKIRVLLIYLREKMSEHHLVFDDPSSSDLISPLYHPIDPSQENKAPPMAIAMRLPRNFTPLTFHASSPNEILRSPHYPDASVEYKKELPTDILEKYAGSNKKPNEQQTVGKKLRKNKRTFGIKHSPQMISLYTDVRLSSGNSDTLPSMPMFEYELLPAIKALEVIEQSVQSYLTESSRRDPQLHVWTNNADDLLETDSIRDSALDTYSETSSLVEPMPNAKDASLVRPEQRSSSSSDEKKTIVSSSSSSAVLLKDEPIPSLTFQIERQVSDEGYRSVRNGKQQSNETSATSLMKSFALTEKVDQWLSTTSPGLRSTTTNEDFQATEINPEEEKLNCSE